MLKLRYEWSNYKHLRDRNEAAGINKEIIDKVCLVSVVRLEGWTKYGAVRERCAVFTGSNQLCYLIWRKK